ncbi:diamine N-acetyltransferase [Fontibacillus solani]|uniref:Diamine N-acetyltransferase n=1 Tax=Fontibacillus solani TaxID=1572857 RepID=A0A7W3XTS3_9BACL|nr:GNAT family N-acetyltransferase [Fontibacillus solani]MBA9087920.1 diamine N-acetyltransferase [Fontibacillus solani]
MNITIKDINQTNLSDIKSLRVADSQKKFIETPMQSLKDAEECSYYKPVGLYMDEILVGFAMYGFFPHEKGGRVWLDRYLIDVKYQGRGLGKIMLHALIKHLYHLYSCHEIYLSLYNENVAAMNLYKAFGFHFNGEKDINGELVMVKQIGV